MYEIFVITVLLYGCETWILTSPLLNKLEKFQSEIGRRILKLSKHHADLAPIIGLHLPSMKVRILLRKLHFLAKLLESEEDDLSSRVFRTLSAENVFEISLVEQCKWLQNELRVDPILQRCLSDPATATNTVKSAKSTLLNQDWKQTINAAKNAFISTTHSLLRLCGQQLVQVVGSDSGSWNQRDEINPMPVSFFMSSHIWYVHTALLRSHRIKVTLST